MTVFLRGAPRLLPCVIGHADYMSVTAFQDLPLADRDREWDGDAAEKEMGDEAPWER